MRTLRRTIALSAGVEAEMLFTPHLYAYRGLSGASLEYEEGNKLSIIDTYKDIMFLAAVNAWELDGRGTREDVPFRRGDFHEWASLNPKEFGAAMAQAMVGLTGKSVEELMKAPEETGTAAEESKKKESAMTGPISKPSLWARAALRRSRRGSRHITSTS